MSWIRQGAVARRLRARPRSLAFVAFVAVLASSAGAAVAGEAAPPHQAEETGERGRSGMIERQALAAGRLEAWLAERGERTGFRVSPLGIDIPGWSFFRVSLPPEPGFEELGEETRFHAVRDDGSVVTGSAEMELSRLFRAVGLGGGSSSIPLETLGRVVLVLAGRGASVVTEADVPELARLFGGLAFAGPSLESTPDGVVLAFQAQADAGPGRAPLRFLLVRASIDAGEGRLAIQEREVWPVRVR